MPHRVLRTPEAVDNLATLLKGGKLPVTVSWVKGRDRTREQNNLQWMWAVEVAFQRQDCDPPDVQAEWKLRIGVPILRAEDAEFRELYDAAIKPLPYELKIKAMKLGFDVTSRMKVPQMIRYLDTVQQECAEQGFEITQPDPELADYQKRYRVVA